MVARAVLGAGHWKSRSPDSSRRQRRRRPPLAGLVAPGLLQTFRGHWTVEAKNHNRRDVTYQEDRSPVKHHNAARVLATMKMLAIFLCQVEAHRPQSDRERTLPEFNRACAINGIDTTLNWMKRRYNPLGR